MIRSPVSGLQRSGGSLQVVCGKTRSSQSVCCHESPVHIASSVSAAFAAISITARSSLNGTNVTRARTDTAAARQAVGTVDGFAVTEILFHAFV
jgi:hypothetical protein